MVDPMSDDFCSAFRTTTSPVDGSKKLSSFVAFEVTDSVYAMQFKNYNIPK